MTTPTGFSKEDVDKYFEEFLKISKDNNGEWTEVIEKLEVKVWQKTIDNSGVYLIKAEGIIKASADSILEVVTSMDERSKWDSTFGSGKIVKEFEPKRHSVAYLKTKGAVGVWPRDFLIVAAARQQSDGSWVVIAKGIEDLELAPLDSASVRGKVMVSGMIITPLETGACKLTYIFQVDGCGWVPTAFVNKVNTYQGLSIIGIRKLITGFSQP